MNILFTFFDTRCRVLLIKYIYGCLRKAAFTWCNGITDSETWVFHKTEDSERLHIKFLKQLMGVRQHTVNSSVCGEIAEYPLHAYKTVRSIYKDWEIRRRRNMDRENIICNLCNMNTVESEYHPLLVHVCLFKRQIRKGCLPRY